MLARLVNVLRPLHVGKVISCFCMPFLYLLYVGDGSAFGCMLWIVKLNQLTAAILREKNSAKKAKRGNHKTKYNWILKKR